MENILNEALRAYVVTFPRVENLQEYLSQKSLMSKFLYVHTQLNKAVKDSENFLYAQSGGVKWNATFENEYYEHVKSLNPWLAEQGFSSLLSFGGWLCWHEGLSN